jgi:hypothetical protein
MLSCCLGYWLASNYVRFSSLHGHARWMAISTGTMDSVMAVLRTEGLTTTTRSHTHNCTGTSTWSYESEKLRFPVLREHTVQTSFHWSLRAQLPER